MNIVLTEAKDGQTTLPDVVDRIDGVTSKAFNKSLINILAAQPQALVLDFARLEFLSSAGIRVLMLAATKARSSGIKLALCSLQNNINQIFVIDGILPIFSVHSRLPSFSPSHILRRLAPVPYQIQECSCMNGRYGDGRNGGPARWWTAEGHTRVH